jgi:undecaprenyl-diphosphatase
MGFREWGRRPVPVRFAYLIGDRLPVRCLGGACLEIMSAFTFSPFFQRVLRWRKEPVIPAMLLIIACGLWGFIEIADEVGAGADAGEAHGYDEKILLAMREVGNPADPIGPPWMEEMGRDLTALGGFTILTGLTLASLGLMLMLGRKRLALLTLVAIAGGMQVSAMLKEFFDRPRPDLVPHGVLVTSASFPSGHAMMAAVVYLTLGVLLARTQPYLRLRLFIITLSVIITLLVGVSRVYLGVHWPTDVLAGWMVGGIWALTFGLIALKISPRKGAGDNVGPDVVETEE